MSHPNSRTYDTVTTAQSLYGPLARRLRNTNAIGATLDASILPRLLPTLPQLDTTTVISAGRNLGPGQELRQGLGQGLGLGLGLGRKLRQTTQSPRPLCFEYAHAGEGGN